MTALREVLQQKLSIRFLSYIQTIYLAQLYTVGVNSLSDGQYKLWKILVM